MKVDEADLAKRAGRGDDDAFETIVNHYSQRIVRYCHRMVGTGAEDLAQEIFVKLFMALDRLEAQKPLTPFLFRIAHNHCVDALKKKKVSTVSLVRSGEQGMEAQHADEKPTPEELAQKAEVQAAVEQALESLPATYRSALVMWHVEGMSYEEISQTLGLPMGTVKARIHRGREKLQQKLRSLVMC
ncbi:MAG: sigma-70 family RNA polymerase sigma factor [Pseudomonadota bacterium]